METQDRRVKRTQQLLAKALIALSLEKGYEAVTIRDITGRADIGYATFFRHYPDKEALLWDVLEVFLSELLELLPTNDTPDQHQMTGQLIFQYVAEHSELCQVLLSSRGSAALLNRLRDAGIARLLEQSTPAPASLVPPDLAAYHIVSASMTLIQWWLEHHRPYSPERMGAIYAELIVQPAHMLAFSAPQLARSLAE